MFLNPWMLLATSAVAVPIIVHLLNRRKFQRVVWAAMRFLRVSVEQNQRRIQIEDMLLLILRCALLVLLALALARPVIRSAAAAFLGPQAKAVAVIVLDNSASMSQTDGVQSRFDAAKAAADQVIRTLPPGASVAVLLASDIAHQQIPEPTYDLTLAGSAIKDAPIFDRGTDLFPAMKAAVDNLKGRPSDRKEVYLITDGQSSGWRQMNAIQDLLEDNAGDIRAHVILVGRPEDKNLAVSRLRLDSALTPVNALVRVDVGIRNWGRAEVRDVKVSIAVDDDPPMDQANIDAIPAGDEKSVALFAKLKSDGYHSITAKIDADHMPADDSRTVAAHAVKNVRVLLVDGDTGAEPRDSEIFYLRHALRPVPPVEWDDYHIQLVAKSPTELESVRFDDFNAVLTANVTDLSTTVTDQLAAYVKGGGALWIFPGDKISRDYYNKELYGRLRLLPAAIGQPRGDAKSQEKYFSFSDKAYEHAITSIWKDSAAGTLSSAKVFKAYALAVEKGPAAAPPAGVPALSEPRIVARYGDQAPAIVERDYGMGRVILFSTTADRDWNDLPMRPGIYVPLLHRTLGRLVARQDEHLTIPTGGRFAHIAPVELINKDAMITKRARAYNTVAKDLNEVSQSRRIELAEGAPLLSFDEIHYAGAYLVRAADAPLVTFAAQADPEESNPQLLAEDQVKQLDKVAHVINWTASASITESLEQARIGTELWLPLAILALLFAVTETVLAHWFSRPK